MEKVYLLLGGNKDDRQYYLGAATQLLQALVGKLIAKSSVYETAPWGFIDKQMFLNQVLLIETSLSSRQIFQTIVEIENQLGRARNGSSYNSRTIDIDLLFFGNEIISTPDLVVPHPKIKERKFVLEPLCELAPKLIHPVERKSMEELLKQCPDQLEVARLSL